jgi:hypothetical protein
MDAPAHRSLYCQATKLADKVIAGGFEEIAGVERREIMMRY